ncbi:YihY/virulence factor BrkB family protein [Microbacterium sp. P06]|uniref:YihY/virulence factor BrkB family protein n=1 Tax=Microbacterium sp. P06 TaxID=3366949 RepID=UPI0037475BC5
MTDTTRSDLGKADTAPHADSAAKPDSPDELTKRSWKYVLSKTVREFTSDQCTDIAAALTYFGVLALFPGLIAVFSLLGVLGQSDAAATTVLEIVDGVAPGGTADTLRGPIEQLASSPGAGLALLAGIVLAVWSASGYIGAFTRAMNRIYEIDEGRPFWKLKPLQLLLTLVTVVLVTLAALLLVVSGPVAEAIGNALGLGEVAVTIWNIAKWPVLVVIVIAILALLYYAAPNAKQPKFRWMSIGAVLALVILAIATTGFGLYVANFSNYDKTYGSLAGVVVFLLWLWIANLAILFGAEFDAELERGRQLQAGIAAERDIQLPPRDTKKIEKKAAAEEKDAAEGRRIRRYHGQDDATR